VLHLARLLRLDEVTSVSIPTVHQELRMRVDVDVQSSAARRTEPGARRGAAET
jgi:hypothetical protein